MHVRALLSSSIMLNFTKKEPAESAIEAPDAVPPTAQRPTARGQLVLVHGHNTDRPPQSSGYVDSRVTTNEDQDTAVGLSDSFATFPAERWERATIKRSRGPAMKTMSERTCLTPPQSNSNSFNMKFCCSSVRSCDCERHGQMC